MAEQTISVELCGRLADSCGPTVDIPLPATGLHVSDLLASLGSTFPLLQDSLAKGRIRACINETIVPDETVVRPGDVVAIFPPVSGG